MDEYNHGRFMQVVVQDATTCTVVVMVVVVLRLWHGIVEKFTDRSYVMFGFAMSPMIGTGIRRRILFSYSRSASTTTN